MKKHHINAAEEAVEPSLDSFGAWLRQQRELREVSLREIADATRISMRYLEALEEDRFEVLPAPVFAKGFLRQYARFVGLDSDDVVNHYLAASETSENDERNEGKHERKNRSTTPVWVVVSGLILGLVAVMATIFTITYVSNRRDRNTSPQETEIAPAISFSQPLPRPATPEEPAQEVTPPPPESTVPLVVTLDFTGECWVEARIDRSTRVTELRVQGESLRLEAQEEISLTLGDPSVVRIEANGETVDTGAPPGQVLRGFLISAPTRKELSEPLGSQDPGPHGAPEERPQSAEPPIPDS